MQSAQIPATHKGTLNRFDLEYVDLASRRLGGQTLSCSDDFFAEMENLLKPGRGVFIEDKYTDRGKWMDGWESRRRRFLPDGTTNDGLDHDWCVIKLGAQGRIRGINADTNHFLGNAPQHVSLEACNSNAEPSETTEWVEIIPKTAVEPGSENLMDCSSEEVWTHVRFHIYPDGGVARLRVYGEVVPDASLFVENELIDLAAIQNGGRALVCSDMFFSHMQNLLMPERGKDMGDGWETKRRRMIGDAEQDRANDWLILALAQAGSIRKILVDTCHFKGNFAESFALEGCTLSPEQATNIDMLKQDAHEDALFREPSESKKDSEASAINWQSIMPRTKLYADREHIFVQEVQASDQAFTHVRVKMYPDGGISRLRLWGAVAEPKSGNQA